jgi:hypothetical protein
MSAQKLQLSIRRSTKSSDLPGHCAAGFYNSDNEILHFTLLLKNILIFAERKKKQ